jgi:hypothetical protein
MPAKNELLVGKYFIAPYPHEDGIVEAVFDDGYFLVRFEEKAGGPPEALAVVAIDDMARIGSTGEDDEPPHWLFFDTAEQRAKYRRWIDEPAGPNKPRIVPMRRPSTINSDGKGARTDDR